MSDDLNSKMALSFARMSKSAVLNRLYAAKIKREGHLLLSGLLNSIARSDEIQARRTLMYIRGKIGNPMEYLDNLLLNKNNDRSSRYPQISRQLIEAGEKKAAEAFDQFGGVAKAHLEVLDDVLKENTPDLTNYYVCQICGYIAKDKPPMKCPICNAVEEKFRIEDELVKQA